jgi:hypothetical protein
MVGQDEHRRAAGAKSTMYHCLKALPVLAVLALGFALAACDRCGDFDWQGHACHTHPAPN